MVAVTIKLTEMGFCSLLTDKSCEHYFIRVLISRCCLQIVPDTAPFEGECIEKKIQDQTEHVCCDRLQHRHGLYSRKCSVLFDQETEAPGKNHNK